MLADDVDDPYHGNILVQGLGAIPSKVDALQSLIYRPRPPGCVDRVPVHVRLHHLMVVRDLHLPPLIERQLLQSIDLMVRQGYRYRDPRQASTWAIVSGEACRQGVLVPTAMAAAVEGLSGVGKTQACIRCLRTFPQVIQHASFPRLQGGLQQIVWLSVEVPPSGKASDLARALMRAWDHATGGHRFADLLAMDRFRDDMKALEEWRQVADAHFLGILHLDEIQNLFKLSSLKQRSARRATSGPPELSIVEDKVLRWILQFTNSSQSSLVVSGTPDGIGALSKRLSTLARLNTGGYHHFDPFDDPAAPEFKKAFLDELARYQYVRNRLTVDDEFARLIVGLVDARGELTRSARSILTHP